VQKHIAGGMIMKGIITILAGLGAGAALMYLLDPEGGNRRRALIHDKAIKLNRQGRQAIEGTVKDLSNRAKGVSHDMRSMLPEGNSANESSTADINNGEAF